jgi:hypothetical protein
MRLAISINPEEEAIASDRSHYPSNILCPEELDPKEV